MLAGLGVYFLNFLAGKSKNSKLATAWFNSHRELLESNFHRVGEYWCSSPFKPTFTMAITFTHSIKNHVVYCNHTTHLFSHMTGEQ